MPSTLTYPNHKVTTSPEHSPFMMAAVLALISGIGNGTLCFVIDDWMQPVGIFGKLSPYGPGVMLGLIMLSWAQYYQHSLNIKNAIPVMLKTTLGWSFAVVLLQWSSQQSNAIFWSTLVLCCFTGAWSFSSSLKPFTNQHWDASLLWRRFIPASLVTGLLGAWLFIGDDTDQFIQNWPVAARHVWANVVLFTPWTGLMLYIATRYIVKSPPSPQSEYPSESFQEK